MYFKIIFWFPISLLAPNSLAIYFIVNLQEKDLFLFSTLVINNLPELGPRIGYADLCHRIKSKSGLSM